MAITRTDLVVRGLIYQDGKYLLMERPRFKGGGYGLPGGHVEKNETPVEALVRETYEELGVKINPASVHMVRLIYREKGATRKIHFIFKVNEWQGEPVNREPAKCKGIGWFGRHELPKNISPTVFLTLHPDGDGGIYREDFDKPNRLKHKFRFPWQSELSLIRPFIDSFIVPGGTVTRWMYLHREELRTCWAKGFTLIPTQSEGSMKPVWQSVLTSTIVSLSFLSVYHFSGLGTRETTSLPLGSEPGLFAEPAVNRLVSFGEDGASTAPFDFREAASVAMPAVVHIKSIRTVTQTIYDPFYEFFGRAPRQTNNRQQVSSGSGVIIGSEGYIVTNNHVIKDADELTVTLFDNRSYPAIVIGTDPSTDLGLIKIEAGSLPVLPFANSDEVMVGEWVLAVGNPFSLSSTATAGIVSAIGRDLQIIEDKMAIESFIQTDAAVNPGNSGGALVDLQGNLIGVNTAIASPTGAYAGYAFAVPANIVRKVVSDLKAYGRVQRAFLGVLSGENLNSSIAAELGITLSEGVVVRKMSELGGAYKAGIREGDVIVQVDGLPVKSDAKLLEMVGRHSPGDVISVKIARNNTFKTYTVTLTDSQGSTELKSSSRDEFLTLLGVDLRDLTEEELSRLGIQEGVLVEKLYAGKIRQTSDMRENFIVLQVNGRQVRSAEELTQTLASTRGEAKLLGFYPRINRMYEYAIPLGE